MTRLSAEATLAIVDGRVSMSADGDVDLYVETPDHKPLAKCERHATIRVVGDDFRAEIELDAEETDLVADLLADAVGSDSEEDS